LHSSALSGGYKNQCKQTWTFPQVFICGKNLCSQLGKTSVLFSPKLSVLNCASLCDSSLLIMSAKDKKSEVFSKNQMWTSC